MKRKIIQDSRDSASKRIEDLVKDDTFFEKPEPVKYNPKKLRWIQEVFTTFLEFIGVKNQYRHEEEDNER